MIIDFFYDFFLKSTFWYFFDFLMWWWNYPRVTRIRRRWNETWIFSKWRIYADTLSNNFDMLHDKSQIENIMSSMLFKIFQRNSDFHKSPSIRLDNSWRSELTISHEKRTYRRFQRNIVHWESSRIRSRNSLLIHSVNVFVQHQDTIGR